MSVYSPHKRFLLSVCSAMFVGVTVFAAHAGAQDAKNLTPVGGWSVAKFSGGEASADSYCALTRAYSQDMVLTLGQNVAEEYSLAVDFQDARLNTDKAYSITLQPGPSQIRAYEMMPASKKALVIRLGYDKNFIKALQTSKTLKAEIDKVPYHFEVADLSNGLKDLDNCLVGIKGGTSMTRMASSDFSAEKIDEKLPPIEVKKEPIVQKDKVVKEAQTQAKEVEAKVVSKANDKEANDTVAQVKPKLEQKAEISAPAVPVPIKVDTQLQQKKDETKKVEPSVKVSSVTKAKQVEAEPKIQTDSSAFSRKSFNSPRVSRAVELSETQYREMPSPKIPSQEKKKVHTSKVHTSKMPASPAATVKAEKTQEVSQKIAVAEQTRLQKKQRAEIEQLRQDNERLNQALRTQVTQTERKTTTEDIQKKAEQLRLEKERYEEMERLRQDLDDVRNENKKLKLAAAADSVEVDTTRISEDQDVDENPSSKDTMMAQITNLRTENQRLSAALQSQKTLEGGTHSKRVESELAAMQERMRDLEAENQKLAAETKKVRSNTDTAVVDMGTQAFKRIREYEKRLEVAQKDNLMLSRELEELRRMKEDVSLKSVAGDWDLEKATMRYNEAEREIKRLGMLLEQQRSIHRQEKGELEQMLFDPAVTEEKQRQRLAELETRLAMAEGRLGHGVRSAGRALSGYAGAGYTRSPVQERVSVGMTPMAGGVGAAAMPSVPAAPVRQAALGQQMPSRQQMPAQTAIRPPISGNIDRPPVQRPTQASLSFNAGKLQTLLNRAGVTVSRKVSEQSPGVYHWGVGQLVGQAEIVSAAKVGTLENYIQDYIVRAKRSCNGDFASVPGTVKSHFKAYEIACINQSKSTSSSVVIVQQGTEYVAISHNASADHMGQAMDARDRILTSL